MTWSCRNVWCAVMDSDVRYEASGGLVASGIRASVETPIFPIGANLSRNSFRIAVLNRLSRQTYRGHESQLGWPVGESNIQNHATTEKVLASIARGGSSYASCSRSRCEQFVAGQRRSATSTRTEPSACEDACERDLLDRRTPNTRTLAWTIPPNPRARAGRRDCCRGSRRHHAKDR
jgi:hypothetical protein